MPLFDFIIIVDWSANSYPKQGADSIWYCVLACEGHNPTIVQTANPKTRQAALEELVDILRNCSKLDKTVLIGFDFPYGFPANFAEALGLRGTKPWRAVWKELADTIQDGPKNENNRFQAASEFNKRITGSFGPFWGCPSNRQTPYLSSKTMNRIRPDHLEEFRFTEKYAKGTHSVWKLCYPGSVGSQALMGIPCVHALRYNPDLADRSLVWPFETGLKALTAPLKNDRRIIHAEIYPSLVSIDVSAGQVKDEVQVQELARYFADEDQNGRLSRMFAGARDLTAEQEQVVENEEGWILGVR